MLKARSSKNESVKNWINVHKCFKFDGYRVFCQTCEKHVSIKVFSIFLV